MWLVVRYFWVLGVLANVVNGVAWWLRSADAQVRDPSLSDSYRSLCVGMVVGTSIPWFVVGAGIVFGGVPSVFDYLEPSSRNPFIDAFYVSLLVVQSAYVYWLFARGGAEALIRHPGLFRPEPSSAASLKRWGLLSIPFTIAIIAAMYSGFFHPG